ncbi:MAG: NADP-dependent oxidoreductase [Propylenella sp.]
MATMKAVRVHAYGGPEVLRYEDAPSPTPGEGELLIRVRAAGVNPADWKAREGYFKDFVAFQMPYVPGTDLSGIVAALGPGAAGYAIGDEVYGMSRFGKSGAYAEYTTTKPELISRKPRSLDHVHAAAVPTSALAAWQVLFGDGMIDLKPGQTVLIHRAAGGVGMFAVQLAKSRGANVIGTASASNASMLRELGADQVIDYAKTRFDEAVQGVDAIFDSLGGDVEKRSWKVLRPGGVLASIVALKLTPPEDAPPGVRGVTSFSVPTSKLSEIARLIDTGTIKVVVREVLPLAEAREAQERSQSGHARGKIVLKVTG